MKFSLRYDMRNPAFGAPADELYRAAIEHVAWADRLGFHTVYVAEHHGAEDGYCPSPIVLASAMAAVSGSIRVHLSALLAVMHDPIRLAEDLAILDVLSNGRLDITLGLGYRPHEFRLFGVDKKRRVPLLEECVRVLEAAWTGEPFSYRGETVAVRPRPVQRPRPPLYIGGSAEVSAYRAARYGDGYLPAMPGLWDIYAAECKRLGRKPGPVPPSKTLLFLHLAADPEREWEVLAPHLLYTARSNIAWAKERAKGDTPYAGAVELADLKAHPHFEVLTPQACVDYVLALPEDAEVVFQPLMGGLPAPVGWASLRLFESEVLPQLIKAGRAPEGAARPSRAGA